jgi:sugar phosphate isomerase/epimerase
VIKLGVNSVLFKQVDFATAVRCVKLAGYDGIEISGIKDMCEHLDLENWKRDKEMILHVTREYDLPILSTEIASLDQERLTKAFEAASELAIPVVNIGPGGVSDDEDSMRQSLESISRMAEKAAEYGVTLCCKAHVKSAVYNTPTTLRMMDFIKSTSFGVDMDPSHIYRAGENPAFALPQVIHRVKHIHIRDCKGEGPSPGEPKMQTCGRGDINLPGYFKAMTDASYDGPVSLEIIGPAVNLEEACVIAAESYGYMNAILKSLNAR